MDEKICSKCGLSNPVNAKFCLNCGNSFVESVVQESNANAAPPQASSTNGFKKQRVLIFGIIGGVLVCCVGVILIVLLVFAINSSKKTTSDKGTSPKSVKEVKPPHYGVFVRQKNELIELNEVDNLYGTPSESDIPKNLQTISGSQPVIVFWRQSANLDYVFLYKIGTNNAKSTKVQYNTTPVGNGILEIIPVSPLSKGRYCLVQSDLNVVGWCFNLVP